MIEIVFIAGALVTGGIVAWFWATARTRASFAKQVAELEGRARAAEGLRDELRRQIEQRDTEISELRSALDDERRAKTEAQTRLEAALQNLQEQKTLLEEATTKLSDTFKALSADALKSNNQSFLELAR